MAEKGYYYLKLKEDFFESNELKVLESMENGYLYSNILLKLYLKALRTNGRLVFNDYIPYDERMLSAITGHNIDVVRSAMKIFTQMHLIEILDNGTIYMSDIQKLVGSISDEGVRKQLYREKISNEIENGTKLGQCPDIISISNSNSNIYKEVIGYLNSKLGSEFRYTTPKTQTLIRARLNEKFTIDDFKKVIDNMVNSWKGTEWEKYLRPETLFGTKFEGYLNQKPQQKSTANFTEREYSKDELKSIFDQVPNIEDYDI